MTVLTDEQKSSYRTRGFLRVPAVLAAPDVTALKEEWRRLWGETPLVSRHVQWRRHADAGTTPDRIEAGYLISPLLERYSSDDRLVRLAEEVIGSSVALYKDKMISKAPGTHGYGLHQDFPYWRSLGVAADQILTIMIALDAADAANGALEIWPERMRSFPAPADEPRDIDPATITPSVGEIIAMDEGDALLIHSMAPHRSAANSSRQPRRAYFVTYVDAVHRDIAARSDNEWLASESR